MLDIDKEINDYIKIIEVNEVIEASNINKNLEYIKKHIYKINNKEDQICNLINEKIKGNEYILNKISEIKTYENIIDEIKLKNRIEKDRTKKMRNTILNIVDSIDWLLENNLIFTNKSIVKSIESTKKIIKKELINSNLYSIGEVGDMYDESNHICLGYKNNTNHTYNEIVEVVKKGYKYKDKILRQAEVIVANNNLEGKL